MQVLLKYLSPSNQANLRLVCHTVCQPAEHTSCNLPCLHLRLCEHSSSRQQLEQWHEGTQGHRLQHVTSIHVHMTGAVPPELFEVAMQRVSQRTRTVQELHLVASGSASLTSLQPLCNFSLTCNLRCLVIKGIALQDLEENVQQLTSTALGWLQLRTLTLHVTHNQAEAINWSKFAAALQCLQQKVRFLQQLDITIPPLGYSVIAAQGAVPAQGPRAASTNAVVGRGNAYAGMAAVLAALSNLVLLHLQSLQVLKMTHAPDIWAAAASATAGDKAGADHRIEVYLGDRLLAAKATTTLRSTLDDFGRCLLQQHDRLQQIHISTAGNSCSMTWQRPLAPADSKCSLQAPDWSVEHTSYVSDVLNAAWPLHPSTVDAGAANIDSSLVWSHDTRLLWSFTRQMSPYTSRPSADLLQHIRGCHMKLQYPDLDGLPRLPKGASSLQILELVFDDQGLTLSETPAAGSAFAARAIKAAAAVCGLQSLTINTAAATRVDLPADLLLPLTAAAGGPGNGLEKLVLVGPFISAAAAAGESQVATLPSHIVKPWHWPRLVLQAMGRGVQWCWREGVLPSGWGAYLPPSIILKPADLPREVAVLLPSDRWCKPLRQLSGLRELTVKNLHQDALALPVEHLPLNLTMLLCSRAQLHSDTVLRLIQLTPTVISSTFRGQHIHPRVASIGHRYKRLPTLHTLQLDCCHLESPHYLSSDMLQALTIRSSSWSGGWQQAAAAWPALERLNWKYRAPLSDSNMGDDRYFIKEILEGFKCLKYLIVSNLPFVSIQYLQPEQRWFTNLKQVRLQVPPNVAAAGGHWSVEAWKAEGLDPLSINQRIRHTTQAACRALEHSLQHAPWANVQVAINDSNS